MATNLAKWASNRGQISKIWPSDGCKGDTVPSTVERGYDLRKPGGHLGNVGLMIRHGLKPGEPGRPLEHVGLNFWRVPEGYPANAKIE